VKKDRTNNNKADPMLKIIIVYVALFNPLELGIISLDILENESIFFMYVDNFDQKTNLIKNPIIIRIYSATRINGGEINKSKTKIIK